MLPPQGRGTRSVHSLYRRMLATLLFLALTLLFYLSLVRVIVPARSCCRIPMLLLLLFSSEIHRFNERHAR